MQLPTKEHMPARRKLPAIINNLPSHRKTQRQQYDRNVHRTNRRTTSKQDTETTLHHSATPNTETPANSASISGPLKTTTSNNLFPGAFCHRFRPYNSLSKICNLCLKEKFLIICRPELSAPNKRNELVSSCRHRNKALLRNN